MPYIEKQSRYAKLKAKERQRQHNLEWTKYYQDKIYMQNKIYYKKTHPLCEDCLSNDIVTPAVYLGKSIPNVLCRNVAIENNELNNSKTNCLPI